MDVNGLWKIQTKGDRLQTIDGKAGGRLYPHLTVSFRPNGFIVRPIKTRDCFGTSCLAMTPSLSLRAKRSNLRGGPRRWFLLAQRLHRMAYQNPRLLRHFVPRN